MIDANAINQIFATYERHGWILRRVLLSADLKENLGAAASALFGEIKVIDSGFDAAWFSRPPKSGGVAWEIRYLGNTPFALLENLDEEAADFDGSLRSVETRLRETVTAKESA